MMNEQQDREFLERLEQFVHDGQPSQDRLLNDLAASAPQADREFQRQLEDRLVTMLQGSHPDDEEEKGAKMIYPQTHAQQRNLGAGLPLTLAAAVAALILVGIGFVLNAGPRSASVIGAQATLMPSPMQSASFEYGGEAASPGSERTLEALRRAGMTWIKTSLSFSSTTSIDALAGAIDSAHEAGFKILLTIDGSPADLGQEGYAAAYANWLGEAARLGADAVEVWTEPNIDRSWPADQLGGAAYVDLLREAYPIIKAANPETLVISAAPAPTEAEATFPDRVMNDDHWLREVVESDGLVYLDCVGVHYVEGIVPPGVTEGDPRDNSYTRYFGSMIATYRTIVGEKTPLCFTSLGFLSDDALPPLSLPFQWAKDVTVGQQAAWLAQAARLSAASGAVRLLIVWNVDFTEYNETPSAGFAILRPDESCPACDALEAFRLEQSILNQPS